MGKYVWAISTKQDNVWLKLIHSVYIRGDDWWTYRPRANSSWYWRRLCQVKEHLKQSFREAEFKNMLQYSVRKVYDKLVGENPKVHQDGIVWNRPSLPKHRFISWLAFQERLQTTARLAIIGITNHDRCLLCAMQKEDHQHLFFQCPFSKGCLQALKEWMRITRSTTDLKILIRWIQRSRRSKFQKHVMYAGLTGLVYTIWQSRNKVQWEMGAPKIDASCKQLKNVVKTRVRVVLPTKITRKDHEWFSGVSLEADGVMGTAFLC